MKKIGIAAVITTVWFLGIKSLGELTGKLLAKIVKS